MSLGAGRSPTGCPVPGFAPADDASACLLVYSFDCLCIPGGEQGRIEQSRDLVE